MEIQHDPLAVEGGLAGLRDAGLPASAVMIPQQQFDGAYLHERRFRRADDAQRLQVEVEAMINKSLEYLTEEYTPMKLKNKKLWLD